MAVRRRVRLQTDERRAQLLELGMRLFSGQSYNDISIEAVAEAASISKGLLYHYFGSKKEFYIETIRAASLQLRRLTEPDTTLPVHLRLRAAVDAHLNYIQEHGAVYAAIYRAGITIAPEVNAILDEHRDVVLRWIVRNLGIARPRPVLRTALRAWIAMVEGASLDWIEHPRVERDALRELLIAGYAATLSKALELDPKGVHSAPRPARARATAT